MKWINRKDQYFPDNYILNVDEYFLVSDGKKIAISTWINLLCEDSECGADPDEYEFKSYDLPNDCVKYFYGPIKLPEQESYKMERKYVSLDEAKEIFKK